MAISCFSLVYYTAGVGQTIAQCQVQDNVIAMLIPEDILLEPPGLTLDIWVAELIMGWEKMTLDDRLCLVEPQVFFSAWRQNMNDEFARQNYPTSEKHQEYHEQLGFWLPGDALGFVPQFSLSMNDAMKVADTIHRRLDIRSLDDDQGLMPDAEPLTLAFDGEEWSATFGGPRAQHNKTAKQKKKKQQRQLLNIPYLSKSEIASHSVCQAALQVIDSYKLQSYNSPRCY